MTKDLIDVETVTLVQKPLHGLTVLEPAYKLQCRICHNEFFGMSEGEALEAWLAHLWEEHPHGAEDFFAGP